MNYFGELLNNKILIAAIYAWAIAQLIKILREFGKTKKINVALVFSTGGFPSSHSSFVCAATTGVGILSGFNSAIFAIGACLAMVVMSDAAGVRRAAGKQAEVLNNLVEFIEHNGFVMDKKLKELLGHTPFEVGSGAILGIIIALLTIKK